MKQYEMRISSVLNIEARNETHAYERLKTHLMKNHKNMFSIRVIKKD